MKEARPKPEPFKMIVAGGGTGGHLFPGIAIANEVKRRFPNAVFLFVVGRRRMESKILKRYGFDVVYIDVEGLKGRGLKKQMGTMTRLPGSIIQSLKIIRDFKPSIVMGVGGYSAGPFCLAARLAGIPTAIHEQNSYPGLTNRLLARIVDLILISFEESAHHFKKEKTVLTGNPVRQDFFSPPPNKDSNHGFVVLVVGGSQGAKAINDAFLDALSRMKASGNLVTVIHQTGAADYERMAARYREKGLEGEVSPFIDDMVNAYQRAHMVVGRAGATTIFELAALGKPSILIPYPYAANGHQETNALALAHRGGAEVIQQKELTGSTLVETLEKYMEDEERLKRMGEAARRFSRPYAAQNIVDQLLALQEGKTAAMVRQTT